MYDNRFAKKKQSTFSTLLNGSNRFNLHAEENKDAALSTNKQELKNCKVNPTMQFWRNRHVNPPQLPLLYHRGGVRHTVRHKIPFFNALNAGIAPAPYLI